MKQLRDLKVLWHSIYNICKLSGGTKTVRYHRRRSSEPWNAKSKEQRSKEQRSKEQKVKSKQ